MRRSSECAELTLIASLLRLERKPDKEVPGNQADGQAHEDSGDDEGRYPDDDGRLWQHCGESECTAVP